MRNHLSRRVSTFALTVLSLLALSLPLTESGVAQEDEKRPATKAKIWLDFPDSACWNGRRYTCWILRGAARKVVKGTTVQVSCAGGKSKGCPRRIRGGRTKTLVARKRGSLSLKPALRGNRLRPGASLNFKLTDPGARYRRIEVSVLKNGYQGHFFCETQDGTEVRQTGRSCRGRADSENVADASTDAKPIAGRSPSGVRRMSDGAYALGELS